MSADADRRPLLPVGLEHVRTTPTFDETTVPKGLLAEHRIAEGVWGRLTVHSGSLIFHFDDGPSTGERIDSGATTVIPPSRPHHVEIAGPVSFAVEFHR